MTKLFTSGTLTRSSDPLSTGQGERAAGVDGKRRADSRGPSLVIPQDIAPAVKAKSAVVEQIFKLDKDPVQALRKALANPSIFADKKP